MKIQRRPLMPSVKLWRFVSRRSDKPQSLVASVAESFTCTMLLEVACMSFALSHVSSVLCPAFHPFTGFPLGR